MENRNIVLPVLLLWHWENVLVGVGGEGSLVDLRT